ncbi:Protein CBG13001, partial [Caenorhabditis briggsae]
MRLIHQVLFLLVFLAYVDSKAKLDLQNQGEVEEEDDDTDNDDGPQGKDVYSFLASRMNQDLGLKKRKKANIYKIPGPQEPLPGRSHDGDYWPVFPFQNQFSGAHPTLPMGKFGKQYMPMSCKPPLCNPYHMNFMLGIEHEWGGSDGMEGDIDVAVPMSKGVAYRFPFSGNLYYNRDNMTVHYGQNLSPIDPFASLFDYQKNRDPALANAVPRRWPRSIREPVPDMHKNIGQVDRNIRMGRPICFRCLTPILLSQNVLHLAHQYEENCYETEKEAKMTCFDSALVTISDGALLFRTSDEQAASCSPIDGRFEVSYRMNDAALSCESGEGTTVR